MNGVGGRRTRLVTWVLAGWLMSCAPGPDSGALEGNASPPEGPSPVGAPSEGVAAPPQDNCSGRVLAKNNGVYAAGTLASPENPRERVVDSVRRLAAPPVPRSNAGGTR